MQLNVLQYVRPAPTTKNDPAPNVHSAAVERSRVKGRGDKVQVVGRAWRPAVGPGQGS